MEDKELLERVLARAKERHMRIVDLVKVLGISKVALYKQKKGMGMAKKTRQAMLSFLVDSVANISLDDLRAVPILTTAQAAQWMCSPFGDVNTIVPDKTAFFSEPKTGDFAVVVSGKSMMPWYPPGTKILVGRDERPKSGDRVVASVEGHPDLIFKVYVDLGGEFALLSINEDDGLPPLIFNKMDKGETWFSVSPIKESLRNERMLDAAMHARGVHHFWEKWLDERQKGSAQQ